MLMIWRERERNNGRMASAAEEGERGRKEVSPKNAAGRIVFVVACLLNM